MSSRPQDTENLLSGENTTPHPSRSNKFSSRLSALNADILSLPWLDGLRKRRRSYTLRVLLLCISLVLLALVLSLSLAYPEHRFGMRVSGLNVPPPPPEELSREGEMPGRMRVVGLVFYGRRDRVSILDCYLQRNLVRNGGLLHQVQFIVKTEDAEDKKWLDKLVADTPDYSQIVLSDEYSNYESLQFASSYAKIQRNTLYIKIDDDVVYIGDEAIPSLVETKFQHPEYLIVSANVVNNPRISWIHYHLGAIHPFLPELDPPKMSAAGPTTWRTSRLPAWSGPENYTMDLETLPPFEGHRWLPLRNGDNTDKTPIALTEYSEGGPGWESWAIATQEHYSLFTNLEIDPHLHMYRFPIWESVYDRISINFIAVSGDDILDYGPVPDGDEAFFAVDLPKQLGRHVAIDGRAVVAHYSFGPQLNKGPAGIGWTDVLDRYRAYAQENVCIHV